MGHSESPWKQRYTDLEARLATTKAALNEARAALAAAETKDRKTRETLAKVRERLHWHERSLLRPEMPAALMPSRAAWRRRTPADAAAVARESRFLSASRSYAVTRDQPPPGDADQVEICGVHWWVPRDSRVSGRLADRLLTGKHLPFVDILRTREAISNGTMLDIGANIGLTSVTRALLGDADVVYAAEPAPENYACLVRTVVESGLSGVVLPDCVAISNRHGTATLQLSGSIGGHALVEGGEGVDVATTTLDMWVASLGVDLDAVRYVKVDTQGHEAHVMEGASDLLSRPGIVWELEFSPQHLQRAGRDAGGLIAHMQGVFTHFIDLNPYAPGQRIRPVSELGEALAYLERSFTDLLVYRDRDTPA